MDGRTYEELSLWEKAFYDLNAKIGNDVWGASLEGDGTGGRRMRVYINKEELEAKVLTETKGTIAGYPLVFTVLNQDHYALSEIKRKLEQAIRDAKQEKLERETST